MLSATTDLMSFEISTDADLSRLRAQYKATRRLLISNFLNAEAAAALHTHMSELDWSLIICVDGDVNELTPAFRKDCGPVKEKELVNLAYASARKGFSFAYGNSGYVPESATERAPGTRMLERYSAFLNSSQFMDAIREITEVDEIAEADLQATAYASGHFRTFAGGNYDYVGARRLVASLCLTPQWANAWGGKLLFQGFDGHIESAHLPCFNALSIFDVRLAHAVSMVAPLSSIARYSLVGWLRTRATSSLNDQKSCKDGSND